jgi:hypothetical protein
VYEEHKDRIYTDPGTGEPEPVPGALQLVFCDFGTHSDRRNVYGELMDQLRRRESPSTWWNAANRTPPTQPRPTCP